MEENLTIVKEPAIKRGWVRAIIMLPAFIIAYIIFQIIATLIISVVTGTSLTEIGSVISDNNKIGVRTLMEFIVLIGVFLITWIFRVYIDRKPLLSIGYEIKGKTIDIILGLIMGFILIFLGFIALKSFGYLEVVSVQYSSRVVIGSFIFFLIAAAIEEIIFRGYILNNFMDSMNKYLALLLSSILFAAVHGFNPNLSWIAFLNLIIAGFALGITYIYTKNLWFPIFLHVSWNYFQGPIFGFEVSGQTTNSAITQKVIGNELITGGDFGFEGSIILTIILVIMILIIDRILAKRSAITV